MAGTSNPSEQGCLQTITSYSTEYTIVRASVLKDNPVGQAKLLVGMLAVLAFVSQFSNSSEALAAHRGIAAEGFVQEPTCACLASVKCHCHVHI